ncbi:putative reverse transcriptase domain-containing protein [Tanacetum coccineum]
MPPRMTTRSAGHATAAPQRGRTSGRTSKGGGRTRGQSGDQGNGRIDGQGNGGEPNRDRNVRDENKRTRTGNAFATTTNLGRGNNSNQARRRVFMLGAEEARQDPNIVMGTFTLNDHYATTLFDSGADYSFVSTTFIPLLGIEPSELGLSYKIDIASGQLVKIDKVIRGYKLELEGHMFDINLIPFGSESFYVIIGMDWFFNHMAELNYHEKVVRIPLQEGQVLRVIGERPEEKMRHLMSAKDRNKNNKRLLWLETLPMYFRMTYQAYHLFKKSNFVLI